MPVAPIPEGFNTLTPTLVIDGAAKAIELYTKAFGAKEEYRMPSPDGGKIMHACIRIGSSKVFLTDANQQMAPSASGFYVYVNDVDAAFAQATKAGLKETMPLQDMFWGDRIGSVQDPFGIKWMLATHKRDVSPQEMEEARKKMSAKAA